MKQVIEPNNSNQTKQVRNTNGTSKQSQTKSSGKAFKVFYEQVTRYIKQHALLTPHSHLAVGVSGGPDSVALLIFLTKFLNNAPEQLAVLHADHGLRSDSRNDLRLSLIHISEPTRPY